MKMCMFLRKLTAKRGFRYLSANMSCLAQEFIAKGKGKAGMPLAPGLVTGKGQLCNVASSNQG